MNNELHIELKPDVIETPEDLFMDFPYQPGQSIISFAGNMVIINLGEEDDTTTAQDWFLNENDAVMSYYVLED